MDPISGTALLVMLIAGALSAATVSGCSDDDNAADGTDGGTDVDTDTDVDSDTDVDTDSDTDGDTDVDGGPDPWDVPGFEAKYYECSYNAAPCSIIDLDVVDDRMDIMTATPINCKGTISIDAADALVSQTALFGTGGKFCVSGPIDGYGPIVSVQVEELANGYFFVPFSSSSSTATISGLSFIDADGNVATNGIESISFSADPDLTVELPQGLKSGAVVGEKIYLPMHEEASGAGLVVPYALDDDGSFDETAAQLPIMTTGDRPSAVASIGGDQIAVLCPEGTAGASIDIIDTTAVDPAAAVVANIPLEVEEDVVVDTAVALHELPLSEDASIAVVASREGGMNTIFVVDIAARQVAGIHTFPAEGGGVKDISVKNDKAYIGLDTCRAIVLDISDPTAPAVEKSISAGYGLGALAVHDSGVVYVSCQAGFWEEVPDDDAPYWRLIAFDPALVED
jgi:hypothetical protein